MSEGITDVEVFVEQIDVQKNEEGYVCHVMIFLLEILFKDSFVIFLFIQLFIHSFIKKSKKVCIISVFINILFSGVIRLDKTCRICAIFFTNFF